LTTEEVRHAEHCDNTVRLPSGGVFLSGSCLTASEQQAEAFAGFAGDLWCIRNQPFDGSA
jgi:hypothetical protein